MIALAAALVFAAVVTVIMGAWWLLSRRAAMRARLAGVPVGFDVEIVRPDVKRSAWDRVLTKSSLISQATTLAQQAGTSMSTTDVGLLLGAFATAGAALGAWRLGTVGSVIIGAIVGAALPVLYLVQRRNRRRRRFEEQFADAIDMMARSIRAGNALTAAIQLVGEEMTEPIGSEFRQVSDEIRLGLDPDEVLSRLHQRMPTEDVSFFCTALNIQRGSGGNLAEVLDRLSEVIRKRFELLSHARVLSSQQRYAAIFVGMSPLVFSVIFYFVSPGYFDPLLRSPSAPMMVGAGLAFEAVGFAIIWRLAKIKV